MEGFDQGLLEPSEARTVLWVHHGDHEAPAVPVGVLVGFGGSWVDLTRLRVAVDPLRDPDEFIPPIGDEPAQDEDVGDEEANLSLSRKREHIVDAAH